MPLKLTYIAKHFGVLLSNRDVMLAHWWLPLMNIFNHTQSPQKTCPKIYSIFTLDCQCSAFQWHTAIADRFDKGEETFKPSIRGEKLVDSLISKISVSGNDAV